MSNSGVNDSSMLSGNSNLTQPNPNNGDLQVLDEILPARSLDEGARLYMDTNGSGLRPPTCAGPPIDGSLYAGFYKDAYEKLYNDLVLKQENLKQTALAQERNALEQKFLEDTKNVSELKRYKNYVLTLISKLTQAKKTLDRITQNPDNQIEFKVNYKFKSADLNNTVETHKKKFSENYVATMIIDMKRFIEELNQKIRGAPQELLEILQSKVLLEPNDIVKSIANNKAIYAQIELEKFLTQELVNSRLNTVNFDKKINEIYYFVGHKAKEEIRENGYWGKDETQTQKEGTGKVKTSSKKVNILTQVEIPQQILDLFNIGQNFNLFLKPRPKEFNQTIQNIRWKIEEEISYKYREDFLKKEEKLNTLKNIFSINLSLFKSSSLEILKNDKKYKSFDTKIRRAKNFLSHHNLLVKPADKNLGLTIIDKEWYISEIQKQLNSPEYIKINNFNILDACDIYTQYFEKWTDKFKHTTKLIDKWKPDMNKNKFPHIYILPKIHKNPVKGRPIIPCCGWITEPLSRYLSNKLGKFVKDSPFTVSNTMSAVNRLSNYKSTIKPILVALDVESMYTKINTDEGLEVMYNYLHSHRGKTSAFMIDFYLKLLKFILKNNFFEFLGERYLQVTGTAMGTPVAPEYANLFMCNYEEILKYKNPDIFPKLYMRYLDDMLFVWEKSEEDLLLFIDKLNNMSPSLKLTFSYSEKVTFLDLNLSIFQNTEGVYRIGIETFDKPINLHLYTDPNSYAPYRYRYNWIIGEHIRLIRTNSTKVTYTSNLRKFKSNLSKRNYNKQKFDCLIKRHNYNDRTSLLTKVSDEDKSDPKIIIKMPNIPGRHLLERYFKNIMQKYNSIESQDPFRLTFVVTAGKTLLNSLEDHNKGKLMESQDKTL